MTCLGSPPSSSSWDISPAGRETPSVAMMSPRTNVEVSVADSRPVSTQENKHRIGSDWTFFILYCPHRRTKKVENTSTFITGSQVQTGTENRHQKPTRGFNFVPIRSDPLLIFLSGNRPSLTTCLASQLHRRRGIHRMLGGRY